MAATVRRVLPHILEPSENQSQETARDRDLLQEIHSTLIEMKLTHSVSSSEDKQHEVITDLRMLRREIRELRMELQGLRPSRRHSLAGSASLQRRNLSPSTPAESIAATSVAATSNTTHSLAASLTSDRQTGHRLASNSSRAGGSEGTSRPASDEEDVDDRDFRPKALADGPSSIPTEPVMSDPMPQVDPEISVTLPMGVSEASPLPYGSMMDSARMGVAGLEMSPTMMLEDSGSGVLGRLTNVAGRLRDLEGPSCFPDWWGTLPETRFADAIHSPTFMACCSIFIVLNTIYIGVDTEFSIQAAMSQQPIDGRVWSKYISRTFTIIFSVEVVLRVLAERCAFFVGTNKAWNFFDLTCIISAWAEEFASVFNLSFLRLLRILRMARVARIVRVFRFFRELRLMVCSIFATVGSLLWAMLLLVLTMYLFALLFTQATAAHLADDPDGPNHEGLKEWYSGLFQTMYTLLLAVSGGMDWHDLVEPLVHISALYGLCFVLHTLFVVFGMMNVLTGIFVDRAQELSQLDRDLVIQAEEERVGQFYKDMKEMFLEADSEKTGKIAWPRFKAFLDRQDVQSYFASLQLDVSEAKDLFRLLDVGSKGEVSVEEFVFGCMRVKGQAKNLDILRMQKTLRTMHGHMQEIRYYVQQLLPLGLEDPALLATPRRSNWSTADSGKPGFSAATELFRQVS